MAFLHLGRGGPRARVRWGVPNMTKSELIQLLAEKHADQHLYHRDYQRVGEPALHGDQ